MKLGFAQVEAILKKMHSVSPTGETKFRARIRNLVRVGAPVHGVEPGRKANFDAGNLITLAVALEMTQLGLEPKRVIELLTEDLFPLFASVKRSVDVLVSDIWPDKARRGNASIFLYLDPFALSSLSALPVNPGRGSFKWAAAAHVAKHLGHVTASFEHRRLALLNVTATVDAIDFLLPAPAKDDFLREAELWARSGTWGWPKRNIVGPWETE